jgi:PhzF family phenazine biosynthesis protein
VSAMAEELRFRLVNVFAEARLGGNPLCVFEDGAALAGDTMQALALQFNLSETTFVLPPQQPGATRRVRIFTPSFEMPFAGHPTLGTAHVVRTLTGCGDRVALEMQAGVIPVSASGDRWTLQANAPTWRDAGLARELLADILRIDPADVCDGAHWVDTGSEQLIVPLASAEAVRRCAPNVELLVRHCVGGRRRGLAYVWAVEGTGRIRARFFFEKHGALTEDPGTGSACANLGGWFLAQGATLPLAFTVEQGDHLGRACRLGLHVDASRCIFVSGRVIEIGRGIITL